MYCIKIDGTKHLLYRRELASDRIRPVQTGTPSGPHTIKRSQSRRKLAERGINMLLKGLAGRMLTAN